MEKRALFSSKTLPYMLLLPQMAITLIFFYWPASQAIWQSFLLEDAFGLSSEFVGFENYRTLFEEPEYCRAMVTTAVFSAAVAFLSLSLALLLASQAAKQLRFGPGYKTLLIWPSPVAPPRRRPRPPLPSPACPRPSLRSSPPRPTSSFASARGTRPCSSGPMRWLPPSR